MRSKLLGVYAVQLIKLHNIIRVVNDDGILFSVEHNGLSKLRYIDGQLFFLFGQEWLKYPERLGSPEELITFDGELAEFINAILG